MKQYVAFLRGINVSGQKLIKMADLGSSCEAIDFREVKTYLQSGNVIFKAVHSDVSQLASAIQERVADDFGHAVDVLVLPGEKLIRIAGSNPLSLESSVDIKWFHVTFPFQLVSSAEFDKLNIPLKNGEKAILFEKVIYLYCPNGYGRTRINNGYFEKALGMPATTRNWKTILALADRCREYSTD